MIYLLFQSNAFSLKGQEPGHLTEEKVQVNVTVESAYSGTSLQLSQKACDFLNGKYGTQYRTDGVGSKVHLYNGQVKEFDFLMYK